MLSMIIFTVSHCKTLKKVNYSKITKICASIRERSERAERGVIEMKYDVVYNYRSFTQNLSAYKKRYGRCLRPQADVPLRFIISILGFINVKMFHYSL